MFDNWHPISIKEISDAQLRFLVLLVFILIGFLFDFHRFFLFLWALIFQIGMKSEEVFCGVNNLDDYRDLCRHCLEENLAGIMTPSTQ